MMLKDKVAVIYGAGRVLADDPTHARPIVASLLKGRVIFAPLEPSRWRVCGEGSLIGLFSREVAGRGNVPNGKRDYLQRLLPEVSSGLKAA
jgi:hypothetical protein